MKQLLTLSMHTLPTPHTLPIQASRTSVMAASDQLALLNHEHPSATNILLIGSALDKRLTSIRRQLSDARRTGDHDEIKDLEAAKTEIELEQRMIQSIWVEMRKHHTEDIEKLMLQYRRMCPHRFVR